MKKAAEYILSAYSFISAQPLNKILDIGYFSANGNPIPSFDENLLINLCTEAQQFFETEKNILELQGDFIIVGDIHGSLHDLLRILKFINEINSKVLFLGDYVDRGNFSLECITILFAMKVMRPDSVYLLRGNHEFNSICSKHGFKAEILNYYDPKKDKKILKSQRDNPLTKSGPIFTSNIQDLQEEEEKTETEKDENEYYANHKNYLCYKYTEALYNAFISTFSYLPISAILNGKTFCIHGGLSPKLKSISSLNKLINRPVNTFDENKLLSDVVWSDPSENFETLFIENPRGLGYLFNEYSLVNFLCENSLVRMIRAHQCVQNGVLFQFDEKCITVFSASSYTQSSENCSGVLQLFEKDDSIKITTFPPLKRLQKSDAIYYKVEALNSKGEKIRNYFSLRHPKVISNSAVRIVAKHRGCKAADNYISPHKSQFVQSHLIKPKLTTNARKTIQRLNEKPLLIQSDSSQKIESSNMNIGDNKAKYLSRSLFNFTDLLNEKQ